MTTTTAPSPTRSLRLPREAKASRISLALSVLTGILVFVSTVGVFIVANDEVARRAMLEAIGAQATYVPVPESSRR